MMVFGPIFLACLATGAPDGRRAELEDLAVRIERLKVQRMSGENVGRELEKLLVRAQELAAQLERQHSAYPVSKEPLADDLRERADALHAVVDRLEAQIGYLDVTIADLRSQAAAERGGITRGAAVGTGPRQNTATARLHQQLEERARATERLKVIKVAAAEIEQRLAEEE